MWSSSLSAAAKVRAHNSWAVGVLRYAMLLIEWFRREFLGPETEARMVAAQDEVTGQGRTM